MTGKTIEVPEQPERRKDLKARKTGKPDDRKLEQLEKTERPDLYWWNEERRFNTYRRCELNSQRECQNCSEFADFFLLTGHCLVTLVDLGRQYIGVVHDEMNPDHREFYQGNHTVCLKGIYRHCTRRLLNESQLQNSPTTIHPFHMPSVLTVFIRMHQVLLKEVCMVL